MTDYNDGKWHGWNGGECPVDPHTEVQAALKAGVKEPRLAGHLEWDNAKTIWPIIAFRVTKPAPPKPREWWINVRSGYRSVVLHKTREAADAGRRNYCGEIAGSYEEDPIRVREVLPE